MAAQEAVDRQDEAFDGTVPLEGLQRVVRARRLVAACARQVWPEDELVPAHESLEQEAGQPVQKAKETHRSRVDDS